ncbi:MAG: transcription initiation factor IIB [Candidatus Thorarchaeota archaeon]|jgi:transcription initiation factor TFIIB
MALNVNETVVDRTQPIISDDFECPECGSTRIMRDPKKGDRICRNCGLVISEKTIDRGPEWRAFTKEEKDAKARTGAPVSYTKHDKGLSTNISWSNRDASGSSLSAKRRSEIYRLRKWQIRTRIHSSSDRNLVKAMTEMKRITSQLNLARGFKELSAMLYRKLILEKNVRGRNIDALTAACIYAACRLRETPRSLEEIASHSRIDENKIARHYRFLVWKLKMKMPIPDPANHLPRIISSLDLPSAVQEQALEILDDAKNARITTGRDPKGIAAAITYIASIITDNRATQREIASVAGVTEVTLRKRYKEMVRELEITMRQ